MMRRDIYTVHRHITRLATLSESVIGREEVDSIRYHILRLCTDSLLQALKSHCRDYVHPAQIDTLGGKGNPPAASDGILARQNGADSLLVNYLPEMTHGVQRQNVNLRKTQKHKLLVLNTHQVSSNGLDVYLLLQSA